LLEELFRLLDERQIPCCVLRNFDNLFDETASDVDLLALPERVNDVIGCCQAAATATRHRLVQQTRFVNHSLVFWNGADGFVRIDVDTEKRWQRCHLLTAPQILKQRRRHLIFDVPDPHHECVILLTQAMWQGKLSERYAARLRQLDQEITNKASLADTFAEAFGLRENLLASLNDPGLPIRLKRAVRRSVLLQPARATRSLRYVFDDLARLLVRLKTPPGISLRSIGASDADLNALRSRLAILFPLKKGSGGVGPVVKSALRKTLFKGGLAVESWPVPTCPAPVIRRRWAKLDRSFAVLCEPEGETHFMHIGSGAMRSAPDFAGSLANFICTSLAQKFDGRPPSRKGVFAVLVGLDGSGKTTLARNLAMHVASENAFAGMRYFHWLPSLRQPVEFPLPEPGNQPRHQKRGGGFFASLLSAGRLAKNLVRTQLACWLWLRPLLRSGHLVLADRYFYNYHLDPVSVKYTAPDGLRDWAQKLFPRPDIVIVLNAPNETLRQRKQELSGDEILRQVAVLESLKFDAGHVARVDANQPAAEVAARAFAEIIKVSERH
jgi:thymidylate kinase